MALALQRLLAITHTGLSFSRNPFDQERYEEIEKELHQLLESMTDLDPQEVGDLLRPTRSYATPLLDVRAFIVKENQICLVRGVGKDDWSLPGGFAEIGLSLRENVAKEVKEETGFTADVKELLAIFDTNRHQFQGQQFMKCVFACELLEGAFQPNHEIAELRFFEIDDLPVLSQTRITGEQITWCWEIYQGRKPQMID